MKHLNASLCLALVAIIAANIFGTRESSAMIGVIAAALCIVALVLTFKSDATKELITRPASTLSTLVLGRNYKRPGFLVFAARLSIYTITVLSVTEYYHAAFGVAIAGISRAHQYATTKVEKVSDALSDQPQPTPEPTVTVETPEQLPTQTWDRDRILSLIGVASDKEGIDSDWLLATLSAENAAWDVEAIGVNDNKTLDMGLMQVNSSNLKSLGFSRGEMLDPEKNIKAASKIIRVAVEDAKRMAAASSTSYCVVGSASPTWLKQIELTARNYNGGAGHQRAAPEWREHTCNYARKVVSAYLSLKKPLSIVKEVA